ncbi:MAG TPA: ParA family protein [Natronosporangium sp.]|nr:ParA family protein [Natronosporangium sp.]
MAVIALVSAKGSPGVTTAALAFTLTWPGHCVLAECDPAGGTVQAGYLAGALPADRGIRELAVAELRGEDLHQKWWQQLVDLQPPKLQRLLLPGITDPVQSGTLRQVWERLAEFFIQLEYTSPSFDVILDCGRLAAPNTPWPLLHRADAVLLVMRPSLPQMASAVPVLRTLRNQLIDHGVGTTSLGLLLTGPGDQPARVVTQELHNPVVVTLPNDPRTAHVLGHGGHVRMNSPLMRAAAAAHPYLVNHVQTRRAALQARATGIDSGVAQL